MQLESSIDDEVRILKYSRELADKLLLGDSGLFSRGEVVRLVGVGVTKLDDGSYQQMNLFDDALLEMPGESPAAPAPKPPAADVEKQRRLDEMTSKLEAEFGKDIIKKGSSL